MSLRRNIAANYVGTAYSALSQLLIVPVYVRYMGVEAYGLVAFFALLQTWFQLLDLGISPTLAREVARYRGGAVGALELRRLLRAMEMIFLGGALLSITIMACSAGVIARRWLKVEQLDLHLVTLSLRLMSGSIGLRWMSTLYRSAVTGAEEQVWLNAFTVLITTARTFLIVPVFLVVGTDIATFSMYQVVVSAIELVGLMMMVRRFMPRVNESLGWSLKPVASVLKFSLSVAFAGMVWVLVTQSDKLILSKMLTLEAFGTYTLGVLAAGAINLVGGPISQAMLPRLARLAAERDDDALILLYRRATRWTCVLAAPMTFTLVFCAEPLLLAWTGRETSAREASSILKLYALGNGFLVVAAFQYFLQYARGSLRLHVIGNIGFVAVLLPLIVAATSRYGAVGAGGIWLAQSAFYAIVWTYIVHRRFAPGVHWKWLLLDVVPIWSAVALAGLGIQSLHFELGMTRWQIIPAVALFGLVLLLVAVAVSPDTRAFVPRLLRPRRG
jgi:O-antigen/teichoic acid export membrane protein